jgi:hypothetical protein
MPAKSNDDDPHVSVSFSLPKSIKEQMDERISTLRITRSDYLKWMVLWELDKGADAPFDMPRLPRPVLKQLRNEAVHGLRKPKRAE